MSYKFTPAGFEGLQQNINISNSATIGGLVDLTANIASTSTTTGSMTVLGGIGITGTVYSTTLNATGGGTYGGYTQIANYSSHVGIKFAGGSSTYGLALQPVTNGTKVLSVFNAANTYLGGIDQTATGITFNGSFNGNISTANINATVTDTTTYTGSSSTVIVPEGTSTTIRNISATDNSYAGLMLTTSTAAGGSSINYIGTTNTGSPFNPAMVFGRRSNTTAYTESMRLTGTGNLGIGTTTPNSKLELRTDSNSYVNMLTLRNNNTVTDGSSGTQIGFGVYRDVDANAHGSIIRNIDVPGNINGNVAHGAHLTFLTTSDSAQAPSEKLRITGTGNIGVMTTLPQTTMQIGGDGNYRELRLRRSTDGTNAQAIVFAKSRGTETAPTSPSLNDSLGSIIYAGWNGTAFGQSASINAYAANNQSNTDSSGYLAFATTAVGTTGSATRMIINSNGNVGINSSAPDARFQIGSVGNGNVTSALVTSGEATFKLITRQGTFGPSTVVGSIGATYDGSGGGDIAMIKFYRGASQVGGRIAFTSNDNTERMTIGNDGVVDIITSTDSTSSSTGALTVSGGLGVAGNIYSATTINANKMQSVGLSTNWGNTSGANTGAFNSLMGSGAMATWLVSATSNGTFRSGIQSLDSNGDLRLYANANYMQFNSNGSASFPGVVSFNGTTSSTDINTGTIVVEGGIGAGGAVTSRGVSSTSFLGRRVSPPGAISGASSTTGGTLPAGTYYAKVVAMVGSAWSEPSVQSAAVTTTGSTSSIAWTWTAVTDATAYRLYVGTTSNGQSYYFSPSGSPYTQTTTAGTAGVPAEYNTTGHYVLPLGDTFANLTSLVGTTAPIRFVGSTNTETGGYVPLINQTTTITGGYQMHNVIGTYRSGSTWGGGIFLATGGNDNYPTSNYLFGQGGAITHSVGTINFANTTAATSTSTGALTVNGGAGVTGNVYAGAFYGAATGLTSIPGGNITGTITATTAATVTTAAQPNITSVGTLTSLTSSGSLSASSMVSGTNGYIVRNTANSNVQIGQLYYSPNAFVMQSSTGIGISMVANGVQRMAISAAGSTTMTSDVNIDSLTNSTSTSTGALTVNGGLGVAGNVRAGAFYGPATGLTAIPAGNITGTITATSTTNIAGGSIGTIPYQSAANTTLHLAAGTSGQVLTSLGAAAPSWTTLTMQYIPDAILKRSVRVATTANITLSGTQTIDGIAVVAGDRVLAKDQTTASQNGIYVVAAAAWSRAIDADTAGEIANGLVGADSGTANGGKLFSNYFKTTDTLGTTAMPWYQVYDTSASSSTNTASKLVLRDANGSFDANVATVVTSNVTSTTASTSTTTGASKVAGGLGVAGNIYAGGSVVSAGVKFSGLSADANTLDAYEEGTFNTFALSATGCTFAYASRTGTYTRIGRMVFYSLSVTLATSGNTLAANPVSITGMPFTALITGTPQNVAWTNMTTAMVNVNGIIGGTSITLYRSTAAANSSFGNMLGTDLHATNGSLITVSGMFFI